MDKYKLLDGSRISDYPYKCKYCKRIGQIYPMHYCDAIKGMRDIEDRLAIDTIELTEQENKEWNLIHNPTLLQRIAKWF